MMEPTLRFFLGAGARAFHRCAYWEWAGDAASTLVAVHGLTRNGRDFDRIAAVLAGRRRVVCPDMVGRGRSDWLGDAAAYTYPQYVADSTALLARLDVAQVDWLGTSMGGLIGMMVAAMGRSPIRRLILNDVGTRVPAAALARIGSYVGTDPHFESVAALEAHLRTIHAPFGRLSDQEWADLAKHSARALPGGGLGLAYDPAIGEALRATPVQADIDMTALWRLVACPVLILRGADSDLLTVENVNEMVATKPGTTAITFPDCGHAPALMSADQIEAVRDWLERTPAD